jgi:hypothetical protein
MQVHSFDKTAKDHEKLTIQKEKKEENFELKFQVFMVMYMTITVFWDVAPCSLVESYQRFRGAYCLHH